MGWINANGIWIGRNRGGGLGSSYWTPSSAVVQQAAPADIVLTYAKKVNPADAVTTNFTVAGKTISGAVLDGTGKILTLTVTVAFVYGDSITVVANGINIAVTNNISAEAELTTYITGLATPLSLSTRKKLNDYLKLIKADLGGVADLDDVKDVDIILAGETAESSLKNIAKNAHHATAVNSPAFTAFEGFTGDGISSYVEVDYVPSSGTTYQLNSAHYGLYFRVFARGNNKYHGVYSTTADGGVSNSLVIGCANLEGTSLSTAINSAQVALANNSTSGYFIIRRLSNTGYNVFINKSSNTVLEDSTKRPNQKLVVLGRRTNDGTVGLLNTSQIAHITLGKGLSDTEVEKQTDDFEAYMDSNSKGLIA